jgi:hypothetical protein
VVANCKKKSMYLILLDLLLSLKRPSIWTAITVTYQLSAFTETEMTVGFYIPYTLRNERIEV